MMRTGAGLLTVVTIASGGFATGSASAHSDSGDEYASSYHTQMDYSYGQKHDVGNWRESGQTHEDDEEYSHETSSHDSGSYDESSSHDEGSWSEEDGSSKGHDDQWSSENGGSGHEDDQWSHESSNENDEWSEEHHDDGATASYASSNGHEGSEANHEGEYSDGDESDQNMYTQLDATLREHAPLGVAALRAQFLNEPDLAAIANQVEQNNMQVAHLVDSYYPGTHDAFLEEWRSHIMYYQQYLAATAAGDMNGKEEARASLVQFTYNVSGLLAYHSENVDEDELQQHLAVHGDQVLSIIDNLAGGNYDAAWQTGHEAYEHMGMLAHHLAKGSSVHEM
jgi:hypothetical protein